MTPVIFCKLTCKALIYAFSCLFGSERSSIHDSIVLTKRSFHTSARYDTLSALFFYHYSFVFIPPLLALIVVFQALQRHKAAISLQSLFAFSPYLSKVLL